MYYHHIIIFVIISISLLLPVRASATIVVTLPPLSGLVHLLDTSLPVQCLLAAGADPHHASLRPKQMEQIKSSHLLLRAGIDDAGWKIPRLSSQTSILTLWPTNKHAWLLPTKIKQILPVLATKLQQSYPQHAKIIAQNLLYLQQKNSVLQQIEQEWQDLLYDKQGKPVIAGVILQHGAWQDLFVTHKIPILLVLDAAGHNNDVRPRHLEQALQLGKQYPNAWLIASANAATRVMDSLGKHLGRNYYRLDALGRCEQSWAELMRNNMQQLPISPH